MEEKVLNVEKNLVVTPEIGNDIRTAASWAKFLGVMGFIFTGFMVLMAILFMSMPDIMNHSAMAYDNPYDQMGAGMAAGFMGWTFILAAAIYFFMALFTFQFGSKAGKGVRLSDITLLGRGIKNLKNYFTLIGIMMIIGLVFMVIMIIFAIVAISAAAAMGGMM